MYGYEKFRLKNPAEEIPTKPHYVVLEFSTRSVNTSGGWGPTDAGSFEDISVVDYYAFDDRASWEEMISEHYREKQKSKFSSNRKIVFFRSMGRGVAEVKISVNINSDE